MLVEEDEGIHGAENERACETPNEDDEENEQNPTQNDTQSEENKEKEPEVSNNISSNNNLPEKPEDEIKSRDDRVTKIYRKSSQDGNLILFLPQRRLSVADSVVEPIMGIALIHQSLISKNLNVYAQVILLFRYGREDEEMMGIRFCNEIVMASEQIHPQSKSSTSSISPDAKRLELKISKNGFVTVPIHLKITTSAPPSIRLHPCRPYSGSPIGTNYEVQVFASSAPDIVPKPGKMISMSIKIHELNSSTSSSSSSCKSIPPPLSSPNVSIEKHFLLSDKKLRLNVSLNKGSFIQSESVQIAVHLERSKGGHSVKRLKFFLVQQVDVAMFSNGSFKNYLGSLTVENGLNPSEKSFSNSYSIGFSLQKDYSWLAVQEKSLSKQPELSTFAPSVVMAKSSIFVIKVHYFVQVTVSFGLLKRDVQLKIPFVLKPDESTGVKNREPPT